MNAWFYYYKLKKIKYFGKRRPDVEYNIKCVLWTGMWHEIVQHTTGTSDVGLVTTEIKITSRKIKSIIHKPD